MKKQFLLPAKFRPIGWVTFLIFFALGILTEAYGYNIPGFQIYYPTEGGSGGYNLTNELAFAGTIIGLLMISFARHVNEDELIGKIRLESWQWAVLVNYAILLILNFTTYGLGFVFIITYNVLTLLLVYIVRFNYRLYLLNKNLNSED
nr:hypothetical protein [Pedobacter panaciterrae]